MTDWLIRSTCVLMILVLSTFTGCASPSPTPAYSLDVASGIAVARTADEVARIAEARLREMATEQGLGNASITVVSVSAVRRSDVKSAEPQASQTGPGSADSGSVVWIVRLDGPFYTDRTPTRLQENSGYFEIDDATAQIVGMGMP